MVWFRTRILNLFFTLMINKVHPQNANSMHRRSSSSTPAPPSKGVRSHSSSAANGPQSQHSVQRSNNVKSNPNLPVSSPSLCLVGSTPSQLLFHQQQRGAAGGSESKTQQSSPPTLGRKGLAERKTVNACASIAPAAKPSSAAVATQKRVKESVLAASAKGAPPPPPLWLRALPKDERRQVVTANDPNPSRPSVASEDSDRFTVLNAEAMESVDFGIENATLLQHALRRYEAKEAEEAAKRWQMRVKGDTSAGDLSKQPSANPSLVGGAVQRRTQSSSAAPLCSHKEAKRSPFTLLSKRSEQPQHHDPLFPAALALQFETISGDMIQAMEDRHTALLTRDAGDAMVEERRLAAQKASQSRYQQDLEKLKRRSEARLRVASAAAYAPIA